MSVQLNGFVLLYRKFREWEWYTDTKTKAVFLELLLTANFKDGNFRGTPVPRGSVVTSIHNLSTALNLSEREVRTALNHLKMTGEVTIKTTSKFSIITIKNYAQYQDSDKQNVTQVSVNRRSKDIQTTVNRQQRNKNNKNNKETSGGVCLKGTHTPPQEKENNAVATSVTPLGGEPSAPLTRREWRTYCEGKGQNEYKAAEEWIKVGGVFTEGQKKKVREWLKENGEDTAD